MSRSEDRAEDLADAIADRESIDWDALRETPFGPTDPEVLEQLRVIDGIVGAPLRRDAAARPWWRRALNALFGAIVLIASIKALLALLGLLTASHARGAAVPTLLALTLCLFTVAGVFLFIVGWSDARGRALGALFLLIAATFAEPFLPVLWPLAGVSAVLSALAIDAFLAVALWRFVLAFPAPSRPGRERRVGHTLLVASTTIAVLLFSADLLLEIGLFARPSAMHGALTFIDRRAPGGAYWPALFISAAAALPYLFWKAYGQPVEERQRVAVFVLALAGGLTPFLIAVIASPFVPALTRPPYRQSVGVLLYVALWSIVPMTAYAVLVRRVFDVRFMIRRTTQHAAARILVWTMSLGPPMYLGFQGYLHRQLPLTELFARPDFVGLAGVTVAGVGALTFRHHLLLAVDRWFLREPIDLDAVLARLESWFRSARSTYEFATVLQREIERALHPGAIAIALADAARQAFVPVVGEAEPLRTRARLVALLRATEVMLQVDPDAAGSPAMRLPIDEQQWLGGGPFHLLVPLRPSTGTLVGFVAIGASRSGLPWTPRQRAFLASVSNHFGARLERLLVRQNAVGGGTHRIQWAVEVDWNSEPGAGCETCGRVWPAQTRECACGGATTPAALPYLVASKFQVERLIGRGATSVVYRALDVALGRAVAIKTVSHLSPDHAERLRAEARAMASVPHPNLALVFSVETWRNSPLLVVEYLPKGTLADRLRDGPMPMLDAIDLGIFVADALDSVHGSGLLHRDIKPTNIGFAQDDVPKLLDFGLVSALEPTAAWDPEAVAASGAPGDADAPEAEQGSFASRFGGWVRGTPLYLSPEAASGATPRPSFDLWSVSMTLFEALAGRHPLDGLSVDEVIERLRAFEAPRLRALRPDCPESVDDFFANALAAAPDRRPASAADLRTQLRRLRAELG